MTKLGFELSHTNFRREGGNRYSRRLLELYDSLGIRWVEFPVHRFLPAFTLLHGWNRCFWINKRVLKKFEDILSSYDFERAGHVLNRADIMNTRHQRIVNVCLQLAERLGCEKTVFHMPRQLFIDRQETISVQPFLSPDDYSTQICLENLEPHINPVKIQEWAHEHNFGFCFDAGHFAVSPGWSYDIFPRLKPDHLHAHNNDLVNDLHAPIHEGSIDFGRIFKIIGELPETITMEVHAKGEERSFYKQAFEKAQGLLQQRQG
ncbi:MAG: TIM barrel protein [Candidatus Hodarchaeota archaeon]